MGTEPNYVSIGIRGVGHRRILPPGMTKDELRAEIVAEQKRKREEKPIPLPGKAKTEDPALKAALARVKELEEEVDSQAVELEMLTEPTVTGEPTKPETEAEPEPTQEVAQDTDGQTCDICGKGGFTNVGAHKIHCKRKRAEAEAETQTQT